MTSVVANDIWPIYLGFVFHKLIGLRPIGPHVVSVSFVCMKT